MCDDIGCTNIANFYCKNDQAKLCASCHEKYHYNYGSFFKNHEVIDIKDRNQSFGKCEHHPNQESQFYCTQCNTTLCVYCKINGNHSSGEFGTHELKSIEEAYFLAKNDAESINPAMETYKRDLRNRLKKVDDRIKAVQDNANEVEESLFKLFENLLETLHSYAQSKYNVLIADHIELRRRYEEVQWVESFLKYQLEVLEKPNFLKAWVRYQEKREEFLNQGNLELSEVKDDLRVEGSKMITVMTDDLITAGENKIKNGGLLK